MTEESTMVNRQKRLRKRNDIGEDVGIYGEVPEKYYISPWDI